MKSIQTFISDFKEGSRIKGFFICKEKINKTTRLGDPYLDLVLEDKTGIVRGKVWSHVDSLNELIVKGKAVALKGTVIKYNNINEINVSYINTITNDLYKAYGFKKENLIKTIEYDIDKMVYTLYEKIKKLNTPYNKIIKDIISDNLFVLKKIPSPNKPYNLSGGWLLEVMSILRINTKVFSLYKELNEDLIVSGIILKKIGLISYFNDDFIFSIKENIENINILSINNINKYFKKNNDYIKINLQKIILDESNNTDIHVRYVNALYDFNKNIPLC